jgi:glycosyltransferase involved in cell wall biosynthesis
MSEISARNPQRAARFYTASVHRILAGVGPPWPAMLAQRMRRYLDVAHMGSICRTSLRTRLRGHPGSRYHAFRSEAHRAEGVRRCARFLLRTKLNGRNSVTNPLVSVVVSAYNRPSLLRAALGSVQRQTYGELEILVQDDSTTDECEQVVSELADARVLYTRNRPSLGTSANLRAGYRKCQGKYFCTLNDDDLYADNYIQMMVAALEDNPRLSLAFSDHYLIDEQGKTMEAATDENTRRWSRDRLQEGCTDDALKIGIVHQSIPAMFAVFRRAAIDLNDFPDEVSSGYDYWLTYLAVRAGDPVYYTPERLTYYRIHSGSQTAIFYADPSKELHFLRYSRYIHERFLSDPSLASIYPMLSPRLAKVHRSTAFSWLRSSSRMKAIPEFLKSSRIRPTLAATLGLMLCVAPPFVLESVLKRRRAVDH